MPGRRDAVIVSACRTAIGSFMGTLSDMPPGQLGAIVVSEALKRAGLGGEQVDEVILGSVLTAGHGQNVARQAAVWGGIDVATPAFAVNKVCGSGLKAVMLGAQAVAAGDADIVLAGGIESMSTAPYLLPGARKGLRMGNVPCVDSMLVDGLTDVFGSIHMGLTAENIAEKYGISRDEQDGFACWSQAKTRAAIEQGRFRGEVVPVVVPQRKGDPQRFEQDESPRFDCTLESLSKLKPSFKPDGTVTAGNASGIGDGAAAVLIASRDAVRRVGLDPLAVVRSCGVVGVEPSLMGLGPVPATEKALARIGLNIDNIDLIELNEAFAVQSLAVARDLRIPDEKLNVNGGAIALGHPIGASGARILVTLVYEMHHRGSTFGLATLCIGGGMGAAIILERP